MKTALIILSLVVFGWEASVPLMYFAAQGHLSFNFVLIAGILGNLVSDSIWYLIGRHITQERIGQIKYFRKRPHHFRTISRAMRERGFLFLFSSKFLYGIGIPAHILSGAYRLSYVKSLIMSAFGSGFWLLFVFIVARGAQELAGLKEDLVVAQIVFAFFIFVMFGVHFLVGKFMNKYFHLGSKETEESHTSGNSNI